MLHPRCLQSKRVRAWVFRSETFNAEITLMTKKITASLRHCGRYLRAMKAVLSSQWIQMALFFCMGIPFFVAVVSLIEYSEQATYYDDDPIAVFADIILTYFRGTFGALVMFSAGIGAIISLISRQYRAALGFFVVALGWFILRRLISIWFNDHVCPMGNSREIISFLLS
jgi:hypothetical protein